jgi:hypothetical protein
MLRQAPLSALHQARGGTRLKYGSLRHIHARSGHGVSPDTFAHCALAHPFGVDGTPAEQRGGVAQFGRNCE